MISSPEPDVTVSGGSSRTASTALLTDRYELTMLDAARRAGIAGHHATFEVFARRLPPGRVAGVYAGLGRLLDAMEQFHFGEAELSWLAAQRLVSDDTLEWLAAYRFSGDIDSYQEGEWYAPGAPVMSVSGSFGEAVLLETLVLSVLNHDSAVAAAASILVDAAGERPLIEMGSRRTDPDGAVAAARAAYIAGFASTSNLEAGRRYGIPTAGTAAHAFTLAFPSERQAFAAQVDALGPGTTLLVDTYDLEDGIRNAVAVAGDRLGSVRTDSGDPVTASRRARELLDRLGANSTAIVVTGDLDEAAIRSLAGAPVDSYGVGTSVVTGLGAPTAGFVYKLVSVSDGFGPSRAVAKLSPGKATVGGRKRAWRARLDARPVGAEGSASGGPVLADLVGVDEPTDALPGGARPRLLSHPVVRGGRVLGREGLDEARQRHSSARLQRPGGEAVVLLRI